MTGTFHDNASIAFKVLDIRGQDRKLLWSVPYIKGLTYNFPCRAKNRDCALTLTNINTYSV